MSEALQATVFVLLTVVIVASLAWVVRDANGRGRSPLGWLFLCLPAWSLGLLYCERPPSQRRSTQMRLKQAAFVIGIVSLVGLSGCVSHLPSEAQSVSATDDAVVRMGNERAELEELLHMHFDRASVREAREGDFYAILEVLRRSDLRDERVIRVSFVSADEATVDLHPGNRTVTVHPARQLRVIRLGERWILAPAAPYRPV